MIFRGGVQYNQPYLQSLLSQSEPILAREGSVEIEPVDGALRAQERGRCRDRLSRCGESVVVPRAFKRKRKASREAKSVSLLRGRYPHGAGGLSSNVVLVQNMVDVERRFKTRGHLSRGRESVPEAAAP